MGTWSHITGTAGVIAKNVIKAGAGYAAGSIVGKAVSDDESFLPGMLGVASVYAAPHVIPVAGTVAKNGVKVGVGYAIGSTLEDVISGSDDPAKAGAAGLVGIAGIYAAPVVGSKFANFVKGFGSDVSDPSMTGSKESHWKAIGKMAVLIAGGSFVATQGAKWAHDALNAANNIHDASHGEFLITNDFVTSQSAAEQEMGSAGLTEQAERSTDDIITDIEQTPVTDTEEFSGP